jgi:hypothetical protein
LPQARLVSRQIQRFMRLDDHKVIVSRRQIVLEQPECLAQSPFDEIAPHGIAAAPADGNPHPRGSMILAPQGAHRQRMRGPFLSSLKKFIKSRFPPQPLFARKFEPGLS